MGPFSQPAIPPATAEYVSTVQGAAAASAPGGTAQQSAYRLFRSSDGKTRVDSGNTSVITDPAAQKTILLDHVKKEAQIVPSVPQAPSMGMPQMPQMPKMPAMPGMPAAPPLPAVHVQDLGKSVIQGQEVEGKRYTIQPPQMPAMPQAPQMPGMPQAPQVTGMPKAPQVPGMPPAPGMPLMPQAPGMPQMPPKPQVPTVTEVWTSSKLQLPMATRVNGSFGQMTSICQKATPGEPHPSVFQIPQDYKQLMPAPPKLPAMPKPPAV